jgi:hypothetical protein
MGDIKAEVDQLYLQLCMKMRRGWSSQQGPSLPDLFDVFARLADQAGMNYQPYVAAFRRDVTVRPMDLDDPDSKIILNAVKQLQDLVTPHRLTPEERDWALEQTTPEEATAAFRKMKQEGGLQLSEFLEELEQVVKDHDRAGQR